MTDRPLKRYKIRLKRRNGEGLAGFYQAVSLSECIREVSEVIKDDIIELFVTDPREVN